jgi:L-threonylcarbamoyladenylate synthase
MKVLTVDIRKPNEEAIEKAVEVLKSGGTIVYPTDTAYGLGVNAFDNKAIEKLYSLKGREFNKPTHVIVRDWEMINKVTIPNKDAKKLFYKYLPGPITLILPKRKIVSDMLTAKLPTLGVRIPDNKITQLISKRFSFPYTTPSANRAGGKTPYCLDDIMRELDTKYVDLILDAGSLPNKIPSTLVDLSTNTPKILRIGPISENSILDTLNS